MLDAHGMSRKLCGQAAHRGQMFMSGRDARYEMESRQQLEALRMEFERITQGGGLPIR